MRFRQTRCPENGGHIQSRVMATACLILSWALPALGGEATTRPVDPRWRDLPNTDTVFVPKHYAALKEWQAQRDHLRRQILWAAGLLPMPAKTPLNPQVFGRIERVGYTVEKVYFESYPGFLVTGNLYRPSATTGKYPGVACPHGHWAHGRLQDDDIGSVPARCITLARMGCVVFAYDMVGYNDSGKQIAEHRFTSERGELWGIGPLGLQLWNSIRVVDFLQSLDDVDPERIGCTGASGGGTQTFLLYAVDDRVKVAAPVNMISSTMQGGCVCENAPCLRLDTNNMEIGAMMAPRPLFMVSATGDWTKNTPKVEFPAVREIYDLYGAGDKIGMVQITAGHNYNKPSREAVYRWFGQWLLGRNDMETFTEPPYPKEKDEDLLVFADRPLPCNAVPNLETLIEWRIGVAKRRLESLRPVDAAGLKQCQEVVGESLRLATGSEQVGGADVTREVAHTRVHEGIRVETGVILDRRRSTRVPYSLFAPSERPAGQARCRTLVVHEKGKSALLGPAGQGPGEFVRKLVAAGQTVIAIDAFGIGESVGEQDPKQPRGSTKFFTTFNRTDTAERVCDIVTAISACVKTAGADSTEAARNDPVNVVGLGGAGPWCLLACAVLDVPPAEMPQMCVVIDANGFDTSREESYRKDLYIPGILRAGGLPAAMAIVPASRLLLHNTGSGFDTLWLKAVEALKPTGTDVIQKAKAGDDAIVKWLIEPPRTDKPETRALAPVPSTYLEKIAVGPKLTAALRTQAEGFGLKPSR